MVTNSKSKTKRSRLRRGLSIVLAMAALPIIMVTSTLAGATLIHDHGEGIHLHRMDTLAVTQPHRSSETSPHHHHHAHDHDADSGASVECELPDHDKCDGFLIVIPRITVTHPPSSLGVGAAIAVGVAMPASMDVCVHLPGIRPQKNNRAPPPRSGTHAVLVTSHAVLI